MMLTQQWRDLNLTRNTFQISFLVKAIMSYNVDKSFLPVPYVRLKGHYSLAS